MQSRESTMPIEILLVEDNPDDIEITIESLREGKVKNNLHVVRDGVEALMFLQQRDRYIEAIQPDMILLDLNLPRKGGIEVLQEIKNAPRLKHIPVVVLTTSDAEKDILASYQLHANCYITKPVDFLQFIEVVQTIDNFWFSVVKLPRT